jgi:hypothetical protein
MVDREVYYSRLRQHCLQCPAWDGFCTKGHPLTSAAACPEGKFPALPGFENAEPEPVTVHKVEYTSPCCQNSPDMPTLSWGTVLKQFASAMLRWAAEGLPVVDSKTHGQRTGTCDGCPFRKNFYCGECKCVYYLKAKLATETCPKQKWKS